MFVYAAMLKFIKLKDYTEVDYLVLCVFFQCNIIRGMSISLYFPASLADTYSGFMSSSIQL
jgi:hypothetical protein